MKTSLLAKMVLKSITQAASDAFRPKKPLPVPPNPGDDNFPIRLTPAEKAFFLEQVRDASCYLEFGAGVSTFLVLRETAIPDATSVESDPRWLDHLRNWPLVRGNEGKRLHFLHVDIGKTRDWGIPTQIGMIKRFPDYSSAPFRSGKKYDTVFIDGRFRIACAAAAILHCPPTAKILIHDFDWRPQYRCLLDFLDVAGTADTLALFRIKEPVDRERLRRLYETHKDDYT